MKLTEELNAYLHETQAEALALLKELCVIPAPSHHEEKRAEFVKNWLIRNGFEGVFVDDALNVIAPYGVTEDNDILVFSAHTDVVFPDTEPLPLTEDAEKLYCPGIIDDTENLVSLLLSARYFVQKKRKPECGILFVANSCEEGLGNLKGIREIVKNYGSRMCGHITFDGAKLNRMPNDAVGSHRYLVTVRTEGGHSYTKFGNPNAIFYLSQMISEIYKIRVPQKAGTKTTYNVGTVEGGTSVNTIAQEAKMLCEYRSDDRECLAYMEKRFSEIFENAKCPEAEITVERVGERPCKGEVDPVKMQKLTDRLDAVIRENTGLEPIHAADSTDANIPLSAGIPAVCMSASRGGGAHTRQEYAIKRELIDGYRMALRTVAEFFTE